MTPSRRPAGPFVRSFIEGEAALGFWSFAKKAAGALDAFLVLRVFTLSQYGAYYLLLALYAALSDFFHDVFGEVAGNDLARLVGAGEEAKAKRLFREYARLRLGLALIPWAAFFFAGPLLAPRLGYGPDVVSGLYVLSFLFIADALVLLCTLLLKLRLRFKTLAPRATLQKLIQLGVLSFFFFFSTLGLREVLLSSLAGSVGSLIFMLPAAARSMAPWRGMTPARERLLWPAIRTYGKWTLPQPLLTDLTAKVRPWLIRLFLSTEAVGIFGIAYTFFSALKDLLPIRTAGSLVPRHVRDPASLARFYRRGTKYYVWAACALALVGATAVPAAIVLLFPQFGDAIVLFLLLLPGLPLFAFVKPMTFLLVALRRQKFLFFQSVLQTAISLTLLLILLPTAGIAGLAVAEVLAAAANAGVRYRYFARTGSIGRFPFLSLAVMDAEDRQNVATFARHLARFLPLKRFV